MQIPSQDSVRPVTAGSQPDYDEHNPIMRVAAAVEDIVLAADREHYQPASLQHLLPIAELALYGPAADGELDPRRQDNKEDFQKQNVADFRLGDIQVSRGLATAGDWRGPFVRISYLGDPQSVLAQASTAPLGAEIRAYCAINGHSRGGDLLRLPYDEENDRYCVELWGYGGDDLRARLGARGRVAVDAGRIQAAPDLVIGGADDFSRDTLAQLAAAAGRPWVPVSAVVPDHALHPVNELRVELAFADASEQAWDSRFGNNHRLVFAMLLRGWEHFRAVGMNPNPHGGVGFLEYRNLISNYFGHPEELGRDPEPWMFDAYGDKHANARHEPFMPVNYLDLHLLKPGCGIGVHRHRDNPELFLMLEGRGLMLVGDWCQRDDRDRAFELRTLRDGELAICQSGQLHALLNLSDEDCRLFMCGGYD